MDRCVTPSKWVTSPTWGPPPLCKQAPKNNPVRENAVTLRPSVGSCSLLQVMSTILLALDFNPRNIHFTNYDYSQLEKLIYFTMQGKFANFRQNVLTTSQFASLSSVLPQIMSGTLLRSIFLEQDGPDYKQGTGTEGHFSNPHLGPFTQTVIGHLHDEVIILLRAETFRVLLFSANQGFCYLNLTGISKLKYERKNEKESGRT